MRQNEPKTPKSDIDPSKKRKNETITVFSSDPKTTTPIETFLGALTVSSFLIIWFASILSPVILGVAIYHEYYKLATSLIALSIVAYLPWEIKPLQNFYDEYHTSYYDGVDIVFEGGDIPPSNETDSSNNNNNHDKHRQTFFAVHPHGAFCIGWSLLFTCPTLHRVRFCFSPTLFASPFFRLFSRSLGKPVSASRSSVNSYLANGEDVALPPGGFEEATLTDATIDRVFVRKRYGFVRLCLKYGVAIRPVFVFGEGRLFWNVQGGWKTRLKCNRWGVPTILVWGRWFFPLLPRKGVRLLIVVGRPLILPKVEGEPTKEEVDRWHERYIGELKRIYEDFKVEGYGEEVGKSAKLEIW